MSPARSGSSPDRFAAAGTSRRKDAETGQAPARGVTARRTKPVRITIDLEPADYRRMKQLVAELAEATDFPTLPHSVMWRELLRRAEDDRALMADLAEAIRAARDGY